MMDKQNGLAENLVDAVAKEATVQVAKWVVNAVKGAVAVVAVAIVALACALLSANPAATIALLALSFLLGLAIGVAFGWRRACKIKCDRQLAAKDEECDRQLAAKDEECDRQLAAKDEEIGRLRSPAEAVRRAISGLPVNELAMVGTLRNGPLKTSGFVEILSHLASLGIAEKLKVPGVFTPTWGLTQLAIDALGEDERLSKSAAAAADGGVRDVEAERYISSLMGRLSKEQLGAVFVMHEKGFFDYRAPDRDPWSYEHDRDADELEELRSAGIAEYRTLGNGKRRWTLTERATRVIGDDPTLIDEGRRYFESVVGEDEP